VDELPFFYYLGLVPLLAILAQWLAWRFRLPAILLLLGFGMILGLFVRPDQMLADLTGSTDKLVGPKILFPIVSLSVAAILFEGGLTLKFSELKSSGGIVLRLVSLGALVTWVLTSLAAWLVLGLDGRLATLLGAILVVTGPTVVMPLLRHIRPARQIGSIVKWEGIVIDPVGAVLAVLVFEHFFISAHGTSAGATFWHLARTVAVGTAIGWSVAWLLTLSLRRYWIPDFLHGAVFLTVALGAFAVSNYLQPESGLIAVTLMGIVLANQKGVRIQNVLEFKEHLGILLISLLFVVLGSRLHLEDLLLVGPNGLLFLLVLILFVRPAAVFASLLGSGLPMRDQLFLSFLAPRGIVAASVSSVFALKLLSPEGSQLAQADQLVPLTFFVIVGTVSVYGLLAGPLARRLGLADPNPQGILFAGAETWVRDIAKVLHGEGFSVMLVDTNYANIAEAQMEGLPADCSSILSEHVREELDLSGIGRMLATTFNDEINTLAVREFARDFGRANVYQLASQQGGTGKRVLIAEHLRGRKLFGDQLDHDVLAHRVANGAVVKKTQLTESFGYEDYRRRYGSTAILLFIIDEDGRLMVRTAERNSEPRAGQTVVAIVDDPGNGKSTPSNQ
jgi:CPA1 family monovalent cation:H+ antiporter